MKKKILLLLLSPIFYSCIPQALIPTQKLNSVIKFSELPNGIDKAEIIIKDADCKNLTNCETKTLTINKGSTVNPEQINGNKVVTIKIFKDGELINETTQNINIQINKDNLIVIPSISPSSVLTTASPSSLPSPTSSITTITPSPTSNNNSSSGQISVSPIPSSTPSGTTILTGTNGGTSGGSNTGGGANGGLQAPIIEVSATVKPRITGVK
ncbi:MAG: hypothetical protein U0354_06685 [Candidatus Sericytochromatia bacterium]